jgi:formylglycine-generating enzyme required for sulfatase activity
VSWNDVQEFIQKLNARTGKRYRLPNEDEWEYACHGGREDEYCGGNDLNVVGWYEDNSRGKTRTVGFKKANGYGLHDMSGNVMEWMQNKYEAGSDTRAQRGGSWSSSPQLARAAYRSYGDPASRSGYNGFRLARTLP